MGGCVIVVCLGSMNTKAVVVVGMLVVGLIGGVWIVSNKKLAATTEAPRVASTEEKASDGSLFTSIKEALSKSLSLECKFTNELIADEKVVSKMDVTAYIKNGAVRVSTKAQGKEGESEMILKDKKLYIWGTKDGAFVMELPEVGASGAPVVAGEGGDFSETLAELDKYKDSCKPAVVADSMFVPPADIKFQDLTQMMKQVPSVAPTASVDPEQVKKMIEQYSKEGNQPSY